MKCGAKTFRTKDCERQGHKQEHDHPAQQSADPWRRLFSPRFPPLRRSDFRFDDVPGSVDNSEQNECFRGSMPKTDHSKIDQQRDPEANDLRRNARPSPLRGQPRSSDRHRGKKEPRYDTRQRHVPTPPIILNADGLEWRIEIDRVADSEYAGQSESHLRIARKIKI